MIAHLRQQLLRPGTGWAFPSLDVFVAGGWFVIDLYHSQLALGDVCDLDLLDGDSLAGAPVECLVDGAEGALADAVTQPLQLGPMLASILQAQDIWIWGGVGRSYIVLQARVLQSPLAHMAAAGVDDGIGAAGVPPGGSRGDGSPVASSSTGGMVGSLSGVGAACPHGVLPENPV